MAKAFYISDLPPRLRPARKFKARKRKELREALKALSVCRMGCAYTPAYDLLCRAIADIETSIQECSVENWGR